MISFLFLVIEEPTYTRRAIRNSTLPVRTDETELETCYFTVLGMTCASCVDSIQRNLSKVEGIFNDFIGIDFLLRIIGIHVVLVALLPQRAEVKYDPAHLLPTQIDSIPFSGEGSVTPVAPQPAPENISVPPNINNS